MATTDGNHPDFSALPQWHWILLTGVKLKCLAPVSTTAFQRTTWQIGNCMIRSGASTVKVFQLAIPSSDTTMQVLTSNFQRHSLNGASSGSMLST